MKTLIEFDCLALRPRGGDAKTAKEISAVFPDAKQVLTAKRDAKIKALRAMRGEYVLVLPAFVIPEPGFNLIKPDVLLLDAGYRLAWMTRNIVTGEMISNPRPELWVRAAFLDTLTQNLPQKTVDTPVAVMPDCLSEWRFNTSSGAAFNAGMAYAQTLQTSDLSTNDRDRKLLIAATVGRDAEFCDWWQLGVMRCILGDTDSHYAYLVEKDLTAEAGKMRQRLEDLYRLLRQNHGLNAFYIDAKKSRFFKKRKFLMPQKSIYEALSSHYSKLGKAGAVLAKRNREAADWVWGSS